MGNGLCWRIATQQRLRRADLWSALQLLAPGAGGLDVQAHLLVEHHSVHLKGLFEAAEVIQHVFAHLLGTAF